MGDKFAILEIKTVVSKILRSYHLHSVPGKTSIEPLFRITLRASGGLWVHLEPRGSKTKSLDSNSNTVITAPTEIISKTENSCKLNGKINGINGLSLMNGVKHVSVT